MAQIPSQRQREVSLEVALPMQAGLCMRSHKSDCSRGAAERSKGSLATVPQQSFTLRETEAETRAGGKQNSGSCLVESRPL